jgi:hypothetical protein
MKQLTDDLLAAIYEPNSERFKDIIIKNTSDTILGLHFNGGENIWGIFHAGV